MNTKTPFTDQVGMCPMSIPRESLAVDSGVVREFERRSQRLESKLSRLTGGVYEGDVAGLDEIIRLLKGVRDGEAWEHSYHTGKHSVVWEKGGDVRDLLYKLWCGRKLRLASVGNTKSVIPLRPEDIPPGSVFRHPEWDEFSFRHPKEVNQYGVHWTGDGTATSQPYNTHSFQLLMEQGWLINRSMSRGAYSHQSWEPCYKQA